MTGRRGKRCVQYCIGKSGLEGKHDRVVQNMHEGSMAAMCAVGVTDSFKLEVGLRQGSPQTPFLFAFVKARLTTGEQTGVSVGYSVQG